jgi:hypothetical protein
MKVKTYCSRNLSTNALAGSSTKKLPWKIKEDMETKYKTRHKKTMNFENLNSA